MRGLFLSLVLLGLFLSVSSELNAQGGTKKLVAKRVQVPPKINAVLDDACWADAPLADGFLQNKPDPGKPMFQNTEVKLVYDDEAVYVAFINYDTSPDSILHQLSGRDQIGNSDFCGVTFSCYRDGINGFSFVTTAGGEQWDSRVGNGGDDDVSWNAVWYSKVRITDIGWIAEFKIPYAALRFPATDVQEWNINFERDLRRVRQHAYWNEVKPAVPGILTQMGTLQGISGIQPPRRIFLLPYTSAYYRITENNAAPTTKSFSYNGGMDVKLGLSEAFTLDATLIPDFGQTISDQLVLNLSAFDLQFAENRPFFTEGTEMFSRVDIFYSRRIGFERPLNYRLAAASLTPSEKLIDNPSKDRVMNAVKISGRTKKGLGLGILNAVTAPSMAIARDLENGSERTIQTSPLTNYNVVVLDQNLRNNSYVSFINTSVLRNGTDYDATVTGGQFQLRNKKNSLYVGGSGAYNKKHGGIFSDVAVPVDRGFKQELYVGKINGNLNYSTGYLLRSRYFDPNDLGFLAAPNAANFWASASYRIFKPFGKFNNLWSALNFNHRNLYEPRTFTDILISGNVGVTNRKFHSANLQFETSPVRGFDYFEPRVPGRFFRTYKRFQIGGWISTDYRKPIAWDIGSWYTFYENDGRYQFNWRIAPRFRINDHLFITYVYSNQSHYNDLGYAFARENSDPSKPLFGTRDVISHTNVLSIKYAVNPLITLNTRVRHYWGYSKYHRFHTLMEDGYLGSSDYTAPDFNFNSYTVDMIFSWIFKPASEISVVWQQAIIHSEREIPVSLSRDFTHTLDLPQTNSFSVRFMYFLDYHSLTRRKQGSD